jgi:hypothetical protein
MNQIQRKLAAELGCAFFDTWQSMGGYGSMSGWMQRGLGGADMIHPTSTGAEVIGGWIYKALLDSYGKFQERRAAGLVEPTTPAPTVAEPAKGADGMAGAPGPAGSGEPKGGEAGRP